MSIDCTGPLTTLFARPPGILAAIGTRVSTSSAPPGHFSTKWKSPAKSPWSLEWNTAVFFLRAAPSVGRFEPGEQLPKRPIGKADHFKVGALNVVESVLVEPGQIPVMLYSDVRLVVLGLQRIVGRAQCYVLLTWSSVHLLEFSEGASS